MDATRMIEQLTAHGARVAWAAVERLAAALVTVAESELPGVAVTRDEAGVRLEAPALRARAFGSRSQPPDPRLRGLSLALHNREVG